MRAKIDAQNRITPPDTVAAQFTEVDSLLAALWVKIRPMVEERLASLDAVAVAAASGALSEAQRAEASGAAHKLAGSLGMYGFDEGTAVARKIEVLLGEAAPDAVRLKGLNAELRRAVFPGE